LLKRSGYPLSMSALSIFASITRYDMRAGYRLEP
jgi:hypothetical protein